MCQEFVLYRGDVQQTDNSNHHEDKRRNDDCRDLEYTEDDTYDRFHFTKEVYSYAKIMISLENPCVMTRKNTYLAVN